MKLEQGNHKSICILSFSLIAQDGRVLRQIRHLSPHYSLTIVGYGEPPPVFENLKMVRWYRIDLPESPQFQASLREGNKVRKRWYWNKRQYHQGLEYLIHSRCDAILANDWESLPVAAKAARRLGSKLVFDAHEYAPLQFENKFLWRLFFRGAIVYFIKKYSHWVDRAFTVSPRISERYRQEFGFESVLLLNAPEIVPIPERDVGFEHVRLVHHGAAIRARKLEEMIKALALFHKRFSLHFILIGRDTGYLDELKRFAEKCAPGRVVFHDPIRPEDIVHRISEYDIGFCYIYPSNYNYKICLPNKFFDSITAGLAVLIGPSPTMAQLVQQYRLGWVAPSFEPKDLAETLNKMTKEDLVKRRLASREAAKKMNAAIELSKLVQVFDQLLVQNR
jgi:glycosyltransferase involved in cell wall biosynthesis